MKVTVEEIQAGATARMWPVMRQLRPHHDDRDAFVRFVDDVLRVEGHRFVGACAGDEVVSVVGFVEAHSLASGHYLYVHDLVTDDVVRGRGHGRELLDWVDAEGRRLGCDTLLLDSAVDRADAHRFYFRERFEISSFHFKRRI